MVNKIIYAVYSRLPFSGVGSCNFTATYSSGTLLRKAQDQIIHVSNTVLCNKLSISLLRQSAVHVNLFFKIYLIYKDECLFVCLYVCMYVRNYKFAFLNRSEPNFAHVSPLVWKRPQGMYGPEILDLFDPLGPFYLGTTAESWAQDGCRRNRFPRYPYIRDSS